MGQEIDNQCVSMLHRFTVEEMEELVETTIEKMWG